MREPSHEPPATMTPSQEAACALPLEDGHVTRSCKIQPPGYHTAGSYKASFLKNEQYSDTDSTASSDCSKGSKIPTWRHNTKLTKEPLEDLLPAPLIVLAALTLSLKILHCSNSKEIKIWWHCLCKHSNKWLPYRRKAISKLKKYAQNLIFWNSIPLQSLVDIKISEWNSWI